MRKINADCLKIIARKLDNWMAVPRVQLLKSENNYIHGGKIACAKRKTTATSNHRRTECAKLNRKLRSKRFDALK